MSSNDIAERLASHPKLLHFLFVAAFVLSEVGIVIADNGGSNYNGP